MVLLWVWTGPDVLLWNLCSFWVSLPPTGSECSQTSTACRGTAQEFCPSPCGWGFSLPVPAVLPSLQPFASRWPRLFHLSLACLISAHRSPLFLQPRPPLTSSDFLPFALALPSATTNQFSPYSHFSTSFPRPLVPDLAVLSPCRTTSRLIVLTLPHCETGS